MIKLDDRQAAAMLLRQWWQHGLMIDVANGILGEWRSQLPIAPGILPAFMPLNVSDYFTGTGKPREVRSWLHQAYQHLSFRLNEANDISDLVKYIDQIVRLKAPAKSLKPSAAFPAEDRRELMRTRAEYRAAVVEHVLYQQHAGRANHARHIGGRHIHR